MVEGYFFKIFFTVVLGFFFSYMVGFKLVLELGVGVVWGSFTCV